MKKLIVISLFINLLMFSSLGFALAGTTEASLDFSSNNQTPPVGDTFNTYLYINSPNQAVNAFEAVIHYDTSYLKMLQADYDGSICQLFIYQPKIDPSIGTIDFKCGLPHGYSGQMGNLIKMRFQTLKSGITDLYTTKSRILANDGLGTNVQASTNAFKLDIQPSPADLSPTQKSPEALQIVGPAVSNPITAESQVVVTASVDSSITGYLENEVVKAETNWDKGYWLVRDSFGYTVLAKI